MDRLRETLNKIQSQLRVLSVSQRLVVLLCAALVLTSVMWLMKWSSTPQRVAVLEQDFSFDQLGVAENALRAGGIGFQTLGRRIFVSPEDQDNAIRVLHESNAVPQDGRIDLDALIKDTNPFQSESDRAFARVVAKQNKLAQIIESSPQVARAHVVLDPEQKRRLGEPAARPTASVFVTLEPGMEMTPQLVRSLANMVSRSVAGLDARQVAIIDGRTMRDFTVPSPEDEAAFGMLDEVKRHEAYLLGKVLDTLRYIPNVLASVTVELDTSRQKQERQRFDKPEIMREESSQESATALEPAAEEGVYANLGTSLSTASIGGGNTSNETRTTEFFEPKIAEKTIIEQTAPGRKRVTAAIKIPRSFLVSVFRLANPAQEQPTDADLAPFVTQERDRVRASVAKTIMADPKDVEVDVYPDVDSSGAPLSPALASVGPASPTDWMGIVSAYGPRAGLGLLAVVSLWMMVRVAKRTAPPPVVPPVEEVRKKPDALQELVVDDEAELVGTAEISKDALEGREVSAELLRNRNLIEQVSRLVDRDPHGSAELLRRWVQEQN